MRIAALIVSIIVGYLIGHFLLAGAAAAYASVLISYHLYLVLLLAIAEHDKALSMPLGATILTHSAFVAFLLGFTYMRFHIPFFGLLRLFVPALAPFEVQWLFSGNGVKRTDEVGPVGVLPAPARPATSEDYAEFEQYLRQQHRQFRKPGRSVTGEFDVWLAERAKKRA